MFFKSFELLKYKLIRYIESNYKLNLLIYNNIHLFKFLLPHEKDYYGMRLVCKNNPKDIILDLQKISGKNIGKKIKPLKPLKKII